MTAALRERPGDPHSLIDRRIFAVRASESCPGLRRGLTVVSTGIDGCVVLDEQNQVRFEGTGADRVLLGLLDGTRSSTELERSLKERLGAARGRPSARARLRDLAAAELLDEPRGADGGRAAPFARRAPAWARLASAVVGPLLHPVALLPALALAWIGACALAHDSDRLWREFTHWIVDPPAAPLVIASYLQTIAFVNVPRVVVEVSACLRFGGSVRRVRVHWVGHLLPLVIAELEPLATLRSARGRWTLLVAGLVYQIALGAIAAIGWYASRPGSVPGAFWLLLLTPSVLAVLLRLNPLAAHEGQAILGWLVGVPRLFPRARGEVRAWLGGAPPSLGLSRARRTGLRAYGILTYAWTALSTLALAAIVGWWLVARWRGVGALVGLCMLVVAFHEPLGRWTMSNPLTRLFVRYGQSPVVRWLVRLGVVAAIVACGFIPYDYEIGGDVRLVPRAELGLRALIPSDIESVAVAEGDTVTAGTVIATLSARDQRAALATARAELAKANAELDMLRSGVSAREIAQAEHDVALKRSQRDFAATDLERERSLARGGASTPANVDKASRNRETAEQALNVAQEHLARLREGSRAEEVRAAEAEVARLEAAVAHDEELVALRELKTPIAGRVATLDVSARVGQYVSPGDLVAVIQDTSALRARIAADQAAAVRIRIGNPVDVRLDALDGRLVRGQVMRIASYAEDRPILDTDIVRTDRERQLAEDRAPADERLVQVDVELADPPPLLTAGMTGYARIEVGSDVLWRALARPVLRFFRVEVWSWLP